MHTELACWCTLAILALGSNKQEEHEFEASLSYIKSCFKKQNKVRQRML